MPFKICDKADLSSEKDAASFCVADGCVRPREAAPGMSKPERALALSVLLPSAEVPSYEPAMVDVLLERASKKQRWIYNNDLAGT